MTVHRCANCACSTRFRTATAGLGRSHLDVAFCTPPDCGVLCNPVCNAGRCCGNCSTVGISEGEDSEADFCRCASLFDAPFPLYVLVRVLWSCSTLRGCVPCRGACASAVIDLQGSMLRNERNERNDTSRCVAWGRRLCSVVLYRSGCLQSERFLNEFDQPAAGVSAVQTRKFTGRSARDDYYEGRERRAESGERGEKGERRERERERGRERERERERERVRERERERETHTHTHTHTHTRWRAYQLVIDRCGLLLVGRRRGTRRCMRCWSWTMRAIRRRMRRR